MRRLLQNLISNALKYTLSGRVLVGCRRVPGAVRIEVWDTGLGIPPEHERAVFAEFRRLDQGARVARGLGLGLSIVERLGRVLEHPVGLRSRPGKGSVFFVTAPLGRAAPESRAQPGAPEPLAAGEPLVGLKVLAIDNEPRVLEGLARSSGDGDASSRPPMALPRRRPRSRNSARRTSSSPITTSIRVTASPRSGRYASASAEASPAILATADRSPEARDEAAREDVVVMNKPLKPAPLRAQLTRYSALREAAE